MTDRSHTTQCWILAILALVVIMRLYVPIFVRCNHG